MGVHEVCLDIWINLDDDLVAPVHRGASLVPRFCPHDIVRKFRLKVSMCQWTHVVRHCQSFVILAARLDGVDSLDVSRDFSGLVCKSSDRTPMDRDALQCMELFCGAFSGWSQVFDACQKLGYTCDMRLAADISPECIVAYQRTFCDGDDLVVGPWNFDVPGNDLPDRCLMETDIRNYRWTYLTGCYVMDFCVASPPCQPWSRANKGPGLLSSGGSLLLDTIGLARIIRPRVLAIELVSGLVQHAHFRQVKDFLRFCGYALKWCQLLNLKEILPQNRERVLMIAIRAGDVNLNPHICVSWPLHLTPSLHDSNILRSFDGYPVDWLDAATVVPEILQKYMDPSLLPHTALLGNDSSKRSKVAVEAYRIRHPHDIFSCIMASYGSAHEMPVKMLQTFGLYGSMVCFEGVLRFLTIPEILTLQGLLRPIWLRGSVKTIVHQLGNAIATPHACIAIMNMLGFVRLLDGAEVQRLFNVVIQERMSIRHMSWNVCDYGWWFSVDDFAIPPTVPLHEFTDLVIHYNEEKVCIRCEKGLDVWNVLLVLMHDRRPKTLSFCLKKLPMWRIDVPQPYFLQGKEVCLSVTARPVLNLHPNVPQTREMIHTPALIIVTGDGTFALHFGRISSVQSAMDVVADFLSDDEFIPVNALGLPYRVEDGMPWHFVLTQGPLKTAAFEPFELVHVTHDHGFLHFSSAAHVMDDFLDVIRSSGVLAMLFHFGWKLTVDVPVKNCAIGNQFMSLVRCPGRLALDSEDVHNGVLCLLFRMLLLRHETFGADPSIKVEFFLFGTKAWVGRLALDVTCSFFLHAWERVCRPFGIDLTVRFLIKGKQVNPDWTIQHYMDDVMLHNRFLRIHTVLELRGGGPSDGGTSREVRLEPRGNLPPPPPPPPKRTATDEKKYDVFYLDAHHFEDAIDFVIQEWMRSPMETVEFRTVDFLELQIDRRDGMIFWVGRLQLLLMLNDAIKKIGVEHMLNRLGWCFAIQFVSADNIATGRAVLFPKPVGQVVSRDLILIFMQFVFLKYALPRWEEMADVPGVWVKVKMHGAVLYSTLLPEGTLISDFHDAWDQSCNLTTRPSTIRIIINGKQASAEFKLLEYSRTNRQGEQSAMITFVHPLRGGGPPAEVPKPSSTVRNMLATWLLTQGGDMLEVAPFVSKVSQAGSLALAEILDIKDKKLKLEAISRLANSLNVAMPSLQFKHQTNKKKYQEKTSRLNALDVSLIRIKPKFFINQDGTECCQRSAPLPNMVGPVHLCRRTGNSCPGYVPL